MLPQPWRIDKAEVDRRETLAVVLVMKSFFPALGLAAASAAAAQPGVPQDLRQTLQQYQPRSVQAAPRQLTPGERAELRRQLADSRQSGTRR